MKSSDLRDGSLASTLRTHGNKNDSLHDLDNGTVFNSTQPKSLRNLGTVKDMKIYGYTVRLGRGVTHTKISTVVDILRLFKFVCPGVSLSSSLRMQQTLNSNT